MEYLSTGFLLQAQLIQRRSFFQRENKEEDWGQQNIEGGIAQLPKILIIHLTLFGINNFKVGMKNKQKI